MASVLGRITTADNSPRGPDVKHKVRVVRRWLERGETISVELPRNLICALCDGGGCDVCSGSGALSTRGRKDPPEVVELTLPVARASVRPGQALALRIPDRGGLAAEGDLPRGMLILTILGADAADPTVRKVRASLTPPPPPAVVLVEAAPRPLVAPPPAGFRWPVVAGVAVIAWLLLLLLLRVGGYW